MKLKREGLSLLAGLLLGVSCLSLLLGVLLTYRYISSRLDILFRQPSEGLLVVDPAATAASSPVPSPAAQDETAPIPAAPAPDPTRTPAAVASTLDTPVEPTPTACATCASDPSPTPSPLPTRTPTPTSVLALPTRIVIPAIGVDGPVVPVSWLVVEIQGQTYRQWEVPDQYAAGWLPNSATLGVPGNTVLNGHNTTYGEIFRALYTLEIGAQIVVYSDDTPYTYTVAETHLVREGGEPIEVRLQNATFTLPTEDERLTLITCHPYGSTRFRLIVIARPAGT